MNKTLPFKLLIFFLLVLTIPTIAQDAKMVAKSEYSSAESAYGQGDYKSCIMHLDKAQDLIGTNRLFQYLKVKSYYNLNDYQRANDELELFFEVTDKKHVGTSEYDEMISLIAPIKKVLDRRDEIKAASVKKIKTHLDNAIMLLLDADTEEANRSIFNAFQIYENELKESMAIYQIKIGFDKELEELIKIARSNPNIYYNEDLYTFYSETIEIGDQTWMGEEILVNTVLLTEEYITTNDDFIIINDFTKNEPVRSYFILNMNKSWSKLKICPDGFRVPKKSDYELIYELKKKEMLNPKGKRSIDFYTILHDEGFTKNLITYYYNLSPGSYSKKTLSVSDWNFGKMEELWVKKLKANNLQTENSSYVYDKGSFDNFILNKESSNKTKYKTDFFEDEKFLQNPQGFCRCLKE